MEIMRRVRGVLGTALTWGTCWALVGFVFTAIAARFVPASAHLPSDIVIQATLRWGVFGAVSGAAFALALSLAERRARSTDALSIRRVALWGALGGAVLPLALLPVVAIVAPAAIIPELFAVPLGIVLGAVSAAGSLHLARRGSESLPPVRPDPILRPPGTQA